MNIQDNIIVLGKIPVTAFDFTRLKESGTQIIGSGLADCDLSIKYQITNQEMVLQNILNTSIYKERIVVVPEWLYKKYLFFETLDCMPRFQTLETYNFDVKTLSDEALAMFLACWMEYKNIYLFGWDLENEIEKQMLLSIADAHPHNTIFYVRKPNPQKIGIFNSVDNIKVVDYNEVREVIKNA
jgi:hypothetical protein|tara:strand:+ start:350 stop:901 length:552 start_codon:yes stop_codon:yes gene_type:complete